MSSRQGPGRYLGICLACVLAWGVGTAVTASDPPQHASEGPASSLGVTGTALLRFAAIGDPHYGWKNVKSYYASNIVDAWMSDRTFPDIDFGINLGDFVSGDYADDERDLEAMWEAAMTGSFNRMLLPWFFVFGNHDVEERSAKIGRAERVATGGRETGTMVPCFAFMWDNILFLVYGWEGDDEQGLSSGVRAWLEFMAKCYSNTTTIVISHAGPESASEWWESFIARNPQVALFVHGHEHHFRCYQFHGVDVIDCGHTNDCETWTGFPWTVCFEITEDKIQARYYDVIEHKWVPNRQLERPMRTGIKDTGLEWYAAASLVRDGQAFRWDNRILAEDYRLQLVGTNLEPKEGDSLTNSGVMTCDFGVEFNGEVLFHPGPLSRHESCTFDLEPASIKNSLHFKTRVGGCKTGLVQMIYDRPLLWSDDVSIGVKSVQGNVYDCRFELVSRYAPQQVSLCPMGAGSTSIEAAIPVNVRDWYTTFVMDKGELPGNYQVLVTPPISPSFILEELTVPESVEAYQEFQVSALVRNEGGRGAVKVGLFVNSDLIDTQVVRLSGGETTRVTFRLQLNVPGEWRIGVGSLEPKVVRVAEGLPF